MPEQAESTDNRAYYDAFAERYDRDRDHGYHKLIDDQAAAIVRRYSADKDVLEVGCGTGLVLQRVAPHARTAVGDVKEGSATALPFADASFDLSYSFKVLAHIPDWDACMREMVRVTRPGGLLIFDIYNRNSLRYLIKRLTGPRSTSKEFAEDAISTRFWTPAEAAARLPAGTRIIDRFGIRVTTPHPIFARLPIVGHLHNRLEWALMDTPLAALAGFYVLVLERL
jgi:ubiquinone/menaquinone biosynthesis C-methylase UbiE